MMTLAKIPDAAFGKIKSCFCVVDIAIDAGVEYVSKQTNQQCSFFWILRLRRGILFDCKMNKLYVFINHFHNWSAEFDDV